jgi:hypothetical protein
MQAVAHFPSLRRFTLASHHRLPPPAPPPPCSSATGTRPAAGHALLLCGEHQQPLPHLTEDEAKIRRGPGAEAVPSTPRCSSTSTEPEEKIGPTGEAPASIVVLGLLRLASRGVKKGAAAVVGEQGYDRLVEDEVRDVCRSCPAPLLLVPRAAAARAPCRHSGEISAAGDLRRRCSPREDSRGRTSVVGLPHKRAPPRRDKEERQCGASSLGGVTASKSSRKRIEGARRRW